MIHGNGNAKFDGGKNATHDFVKQCEKCGQRIDARKWHTAAMVESSDGEPRILSFCSESCRDRWEG